MIKHFTDRGHQVWVASLSRSNQESETGLGLAKYCQEFRLAEVGAATQTLRMVARLPTLIPSSMGYFYSRKLKQAIDALLQQHEFELIFVHCSSVAQYVSHVDNMPKLLDFGDMDSQKWLIYSHFKPFPLNMGYWLEGSKLQRKERILARQFDLCTCTTRTELETLRNLRSAPDTDWFPNGVDAEYFRPNGSGYQSNHVSFVGRMDYYPNQECMIRFCQQILPLVQSSMPEARLTIVGAEPSREIRELAQLKGVTVTGSVDDVRPYVQNSATMVAPLAIARGTQNKILEAMAMGVPVVTSIEAAGGVDAEVGHHLLVATTPQEYAEAILRLMQNSEQREQLSKAARERVLKHHHWPTSMQRMEIIAQRCVENFRRTKNG